MAFQRTIFNPTRPNEELESVPELRAFPLSRWLEKYAGAEY